MSEALYQRIAASLRQRVLNGAHPVGDVLPSENEMAGAYRTSRATIRKAYQVLESEGLIKPRQGKGYIVQPPRHQTFTMIFTESGQQGNYRYLGVLMQQPDGEVSRTLGLHDGQPVIAVRRVLEREGKPVAYDEKFIPYSRGVPIVEQEMHFSEFPDMFTARFSAVSLRTEMHIQAELPPDYARETLQLPAQRLLTVKRLILSAEGERIGFSRVYLTDDFGGMQASSGYYALG